MGAEKSGEKSKKRIHEPEEEPLWRTKNRRLPPIGGTGA